MIDIVMDKERNLKNLRQIGTPQEENKIYVENLVYSKMKEDNQKNRKVFVLMGHTERMNGNYATFAEAIIPVYDMEYVAGVPKWNNKIWVGVFREIKRLYEDMIIVGWGYDTKGFSTRMTPDLERVHREHFGGNHQIFLLMDSTEKEETFYTYKDGQLISKKGFYIYYHSQTPKSVTQNEILNFNTKVLEDFSTKKDEKIFSEVIEKEMSAVPRGRYREIIVNQQKKEEKAGSNLGIGVAVALLIFVLGVGAYENRDSLFGGVNVPVIEETGYVPTESTETRTSEVVSGEVSSEVMQDVTDNTIPVEIIPGEEEKNSE